MYGHWVEASTYDLTLVTMSGANRPAVEFGDWKVQAFPVNHIESSVGYRVTHATGKTFVYTGDTDLCDDLIPLARNADLLLIESSSPDEEKMPKHLTPSEAGDVARQANAGKVVLTHLYPACDNADMLGQLRRTYDGEAMIAEDGVTVKI